jgi:endonuclease YncB( thermonuclease family)
VDTAETNHPDYGKQEWGKLGSVYMCDLLTDATNIYLQSDPVSGSRDNYERMLGWIWADGELVQYNLVALGLADTKYSYFDGKAELYADLLIDRYDKAVIDQVGRWGRLLPEFCSLKLILWKLSRYKSAFFYNLFQIFVVINCD